MTTATLSDMGTPLPSGVIVFLLTDVEGSTERWERSPEPMRLAVARHDHLLRGEIVQRGGHVFRTAGDAFFAAFASPADAIAAALAAQRALATEDFSSVGGLAVRMAIHAGPVEARDGDYFGPGINRCARLLSVAYGGQILISGGAAEMASGYLPQQSSLMDLGLHRLKNIPEPESVHQLVAPGLRWKFPSLPSLASTVHNLPQQLTSFVGCEHDLAEVNSRLQRYRLVTLLGAGGAGKTRIALEIASGFLNKALDGVWLVELAALEHPQLVAEAVCSTIGVPVAGSRSATVSAVGYLCRKKALLVLDNCEHLVEAVASLVDALMRGCPSLLVLATSRERLGVQGESPYRVSSLGLPPPAASMTAAQALQHDAVRLFAERAGAMVEGFAITDANAATVANICRQLDGIPLAIELVVPQLRMLRPQGLAAHLRDRLLAVKGDRTALPRHQTLRSLFDWSYNLLSEEERRLFRRLSVFVGGWSLQAATTVTGGLQGSGDDGFELLSELADKSLVVADLGGHEPRYNYLQPVREYAFGKLRESGERGLRRRMAAYMLQMFAEASASWPTMATRTWLARYEPELDNLRASLDWAFAPEGNAALGVELCSYSIRIWDELSLFAECERWLATAFDRADADADPLTMARLWLGRVSNSAHGDRTNFDHARRAATLFREAGDQVGLGEALAKAGAALETLESTAEAAPYLQEALAVLRPLGPTKQLASCLRSLGVAQYFVANFEGARPLMAQSEAVANSIGDARGLAAVQIAAAELEFAAGNLERAIAVVKSMLDGSDRNRRQMVLGLTNLASYLLACGRTNEAEQAALEALTEASALGWHAAVIRALEHLALVTALGGNIELAARLLGHGVAFYARGTATREFTELASYKRLSETLATALPPERITQLMSEGALWTQDQAVQEATKPYRPGRPESKLPGS
jgi:predicted ATPase/class 3 adenylate cyclase